MDNGSECQNEDMTLNAKLKKMMDLKCQAEEDNGSKCQIEDMALNA